MPERNLGAECEKSLWVYVIKSRLCLLVEEGKEEGVNRRSQRWLDEKMRGRVGLGGLSVRKMDRSAVQIYGVDVRRDFP